MNEFISRFICNIFFKMCFHVFYFFKNNFKQKQAQMHAFYVEFFSIERSLGGEGEGANQSVAMTRQLEPHQNHSILTIFYLNTLFKYV